MNEAFEEVDGSFKFTGTLIVYRAGKNMRHAVSKARYVSPSEVRVEYLINDILIPSSAYSPPFLSQFTRVPVTLSCCSFVKKLRLISYDGVQRGSQLLNHIADSLLKEVEVCESLKRHPHPKVSAYLGCQVSDGRITGICFAKYDCTLMQRANPGSFMKRKSRAVGNKTEDYSRILEGVESRIRHLHSLGLVHNDINPSNIMDGDVPVIIDLDSCRRVGESLKEVGRTCEWYDEQVQLSLPKNDLDALEEIHIWLGEESNLFQFDE